MRPGQILGIIITICSFILTIPVCKKAMKVADLYAIPFFTGLLGFSVVGFICKLIDLNDHHFFREIFEILGLFIGIYVGNKYKQVTKVLVTSIMGAALCTYGATLALKWQPIMPAERPVLYIIYVVANFLLAICAYAYQRYQIRKFNSTIAAQASRSNLYDGLNDDERRNQKLEKITAFLKTQNDSFMDNNNINGNTTQSSIDGQSLI